MKIAGSSVTPVMATCAVPDPEPVVSWPDAVVHVPARTRSAARRRENKSLLFLDVVWIIMEILHAVIFVCNFF
jgi:hypothetical protein